MRGLAFRRHQMKRIKKKRARYWAGHAGSDPRLLGIVASTPHPCSCWMCGHQREHYGPTIQERRALGLRRYYGTRPGGVGYRHR